MPRTIRQTETQEGDQNRNKALYGRLPPDTIENREIRKTSRPKQLPASTGEAESCPDCSTGLKQAERGEYEEWYCPDCGKIYKIDDVDPGPDWRSFKDSEASPRAKPRREMRHDYGMGTKLSSNSNTGQQWSRMQTLNGRSKRDKMDRGLAAAFTTIRTVVSQLGHSRSVAIRACNLFRRAQSEGVYGPGNTRERYVGAAVLAACREMEITVLPTEITSHLALDDADINGDKNVTTAIWRTYSTLCRGLSLTPRLLSPADYVPLLVSRLDEGREESFAPLTVPTLEIAEVAGEQQWAVGRNPRVIAGAAAYIVGQAFCEYPPTQATISEAIDMSSHSLRNAKEDILSECGSLVDEVTSTSISQHAAL